jgi:hypothetical protein
MKYSYLSELIVTELWQLELVEEKLLASGTSRLLMEQTLFISTTECKHSHFIKPCKTDLRLATSINNDS